MLLITVPITHTQAGAGARDTDRNPPSTTPAPPQNPPWSPQPMLKRLCKRSAVLQGIQEGILLGVQQIFPNLISCMLYSKRTSVCHIIFASMRQSTFKL